MAWKHPSNTPVYCLAYQTSGDYDHKFGTRLLKVKEDTLFFITKNTPYSVKCQKQGEAICVTFTADTELPFSVYDCKSHPEIKALFKKLLSCKSLESEINYCTATAIIYEIFAFMYKKRTPDYLGNKGKSRLSAAVEYMHECYQKSDVCIEDVAQKFGMSSKHFRTLFKSAYNSSPSQYLISLRLQAASKLLSETNMTVGEISEECGFCDVYYFSKLFKTRFGLAPTEYRKRALSVPTIT